MGFIFGMMLFIKFNNLWYELGKLEVFGFKAAVAMILMMILPFFLIAAPFLGIWLGVVMAGRLHNKIYGMQKDLQQKGISIIGAGIVIAIIVSGYLVLANFSFHSWPFAKPLLAPEPKPTSESVLPTPLSGVTQPPAPAGVSSSNKPSSETREKIGVYLKSAEKLLADFDSYEAKSQIALKNKSLSGIAQSKKDLELITGQWKALIPPQVLKTANQFMLEALDYEKQSITLTEEGLSNKDPSRIIQAIGLTDKVADNIFKAKEEMRRVMLNFPN